MMRCKFRVDRVTYEPEQATLELSAVTAGTSRENSEFFRWTPSGQLKLSVVRHEVASKLRPGQEVYLDITPVAEAD